MSFTSDERLGWLTFCPTNLGTAIRASVHIKLPLLARGGMDALQEVADQWQLQVRGSAGEHSEAEGGKYDISNRERMGLTEAEAVGKMWSGVKAMIQVGQPAHVATDASSERVMKQKIANNFLIVL